MMLKAVVHDKSRENAGPRSRPHPPLHRNSPFGPRKWAPCWDLDATMRTARSSAAALRSKACNRMPNGMEAISSAIGPANWAMVERSRWVRLKPKLVFLNSNSKVPVLHPTPARRTARPYYAPPFVSSFAVKPCITSVSPPRAPSRW